MRQRIALAAHFRIGDEIFCRVADVYHVVYLPIIRQAEQLPGFGFVKVADPDRAETDAGCLTASCALRRIVASVDAA